MTRQERSLVLSVSGPVTGGEGGGGCEQSTALVVYVSAKTRRKNTSLSHENATELATEISPAILRETFHGTILQIFPVDPKFVTLYVYLTNIHWFAVV